MMPGLMKSAGPQEIRLAGLRYHPVALVLVPFFQTHIE